MSWSLNGSNWCQEKMIPQVRASRLILSYERMLRDHPDRSLQYGRNRDSDDIRHMSHDNPAILPPIETAATALVGTAVFLYCKCTGCVNAPLPAESQTENRTHFLPDGSNGMRNRCDPNGG